MTSRRRGVTLMDMLVLILVIGLLIGLLLPAITTSHTRGRRMQCSSNLKNVGLGLQGYLNAKNYYPNAGTFREFPQTVDPSSSTIQGCFSDVTGAGFLPAPGLATDQTGDFGPLQSWVINILPYIDANDIADAWDRKRGYASTFQDPANGSPSNAILASKSIGVITCPDDLSVRPGQGNLSYVVNGGFSRWVGDPTIGWTGTKNGGSDSRTGPDWGIDVAAQTGVMFLGTDTGRAAWDRRTTAKSIVDGISQTILASENLGAGASPGSPATAGLATNWACPHPNAVMFIASDKICPSGRCPTGKTWPTLTPGVYRDGDAWASANSPRNNPFESINCGAGNLLPEGKFPFPSSNHTGGVNVLFCDGGVRFVAETIDGSVYARLITPDGNRLPSAYRQSPLTDDDF
jgi:prepilin-type processing-associated H-X9-DG protein